MQTINLTKKAIVVMAMTAALALAGCAPTGSGAGGGAEAPLAQSSFQPDESADGFDLQALINAAKAEGPITIYDQTGKIVDTAKAFSEFYGIQATGVKVELGAIEKVNNEFKSGNVIADVVVNEDMPSFSQELLTTGKLVNWVPGDMKANIPEGEQYPLVLHKGPMGWAYNPSVYGDTCPVTNIWQLTTPEYAGKVALADPLSNSKYPYWFNVMEANDEDALRALYKEEFGKDLGGTDSAAKVWVEGIAKNKPQLMKTDEEVSAAIGAANQEKPSFGFISMAKFRNIKSKGYSLALCDGMKPSTLQAFPSAIAYAAKSKSPNAAKLFIHYMLTEDGFALQRADGKPSSNTAMAPPVDPSKVGEFLDQIADYPAKDLAGNYANRTVWEDLWRGNHN